jgi:hypothetical protein
MKDESRPVSKLGSEIDARTSPSTPAKSPLVVRSEVTPGRPYREYRPSLRRDFFYMCAYCTMMEAEATGIPFDIDHYEPTSARPELKDDYGNLMYACDPCNARKGDRCPPESARVDGIRFFRPDRDVYAAHFELNGIRLNGKSKIGDYTIDAIDLNRKMLTTLRELRQRSDAAHEYMLEGIAGLRDFPLDRLPQQIRGRAYAARKAVCRDADTLAAKIDAILREEARSPLLEKAAAPDHDDSDRARRDRLKAHEADYRGSWRGRTRKI